MSSYRAAVLVEPNRVETWDVPLVDPPPGGALVSVVLGGVCGSDVHITSGEAGVMPFPIILGHEGIGRIEKLGDGVTTDYASNPDQGRRLCHLVADCVVPSFAIHAQCWNKRHARTRVSSNTRKSLTGPATRTMRGCRAVCRSIACRNMRVRKPSPRWAAPFRRHCVDSNNADRFGRVIP